MFLFIHKLCSLGVFADTELKLVSVKEGDSVTLNPGFTEMMDDDLIQWRFWIENTLIAEINVTADRFTVYDDVLDGRFRDRLKLDNQTGSLTITDITAEDNGVYNGEMINRMRKLFFLAFYGEFHLFYFLFTRYNVKPHSILLIWCLFCCFILLFICKLNLKLITVVGGGGGGGGILSPADFVRLPTDKEIISL